MEKSGVGMGDRHDYVALEWVKGEIAETLKQARHALEEHVENPEGSAQLRFCLTYVHQVHGTLQMVEFFGAALLAEEMERLLEALLDKRVNNINEALEVLMQAILQLPVYLDRIQSARRDLPMVVMPLLNDLRAARGEQLLSESTLFTPAIPPAHPPLAEQRIKQLSVPELSILLRRLRQMLQVSMVGVLRGQDLASNLGHMASVFSRLDSLSKGAPLQPLWQVAAGLVDGLANGSVKTGAAVRALLSQVDRELRRLVAEEAAGLNQPAPTDLIKNLLFYVAKAQVNSPRLEHLHATYRLDEALSSEFQLDGEQADLSGPDHGAMRSVVAALCEELAGIKDSLDIFVRGDRQQLEALEALQAPLKQISDTLAVLGFAHPRKVILEQIEVMGGLVSGAQEVSDAVLMDVAGALLYTEATLTGMVGSAAGSPQGQSLVPSTDLGQLHRVVIQEAKTGLEEAKDGIIEFIASQWQHQHLAKVPQVLNQVRGALVMIPLPRAAALIERCQHYIEEQLLAEQAIPNWENLDTLADAITSVEYYLERLVDDHGSQGESILDVAEESLISLGYIPERSDSAAPDEQTISVEEISVEPAATDTSSAVKPAAEASLQLVETAPEPRVDERPQVSEETHATVAAEVEQTPEADDQDVIIDPADIPMVELAQVIVPEPEPEQVVETSLADVVSSSATAINPPATEVPESINPPPADEEPMDEELREIFVEEAEEVLATLNEYYPQWRAQHDDQNALTEIRRAFHTLKGSGRMVRALVAGELAWAMENMLNRVLEGGLPVSEPMLSLLAEVIQLFPELVAEYAAQQQRQRDDVDQLAASAHALARNEPVPVFASPDTAEQVGPEPAVDEAVETAGSAESAVIDPVLLDIFKTESAAHLQALADFIADSEQQLQPQPISDELQRALHTLKGSAFMAGILPVADIAVVLEKMAKDYQANLLPVQHDEIQLLAEAQQLLQVGVEQLDTTPLKAIAGAQPLLAALSAQIHERLAQADASLAADPQGAGDPKAISTFLVEGVNALLDMDEQLERWRSHPVQAAELRPVLDELNALGASAKTAELPQLEELSSALLELYSAVKNGRLSITERFITEAGQAHEVLLCMLDQVAAGLQVEPRDDCVDTVYALLTEELQPVETDAAVVQEATEQAASPAEKTPAELSTELLDDRATVVSEFTAAAGPLVSEHAVTPDTLEQELDAIASPVAGLDSLVDGFDGDVRDPEMVAIFLEEGFEIIDKATAALLRWIEQPDNLVELAILQRDLHTLKGGARMVEIPEIGDLGHELEFLYEDLTAGRLPTAEPLFDLLQDCHDCLAVMLEAVRDHQQLPDGQRLMARIKQMRASASEQPLETASAEPLPLKLAQPIVTAPAALAAQTQAANVLPFMQKVQHKEERSSTQRSPQEHIRVPAELLEELVNLAGETSIFRGRIEQQVSDFDFTLSEMDATIDRVRDQLRRLDTETQAQILSRHQADTDRVGYEDFDPLEMDRYSQLQQLSRSLFESSSDLLDLKETLAARTRDAETLLLQQARVNTELQEGLMRTHMVPFEHLLPRLRRLVRQMSSELGKKVEFVIVNAEGEVDRSVLERMLAPLEHMLRNAVDHGIETVEERLAAGKPAIGTIRLELSREGADIVLQLSDDGAGIAIDAVRQKAFERGLISSLTELTDQEVMQFILHAGFTTAKHVTQVSGRGVGMDVVNSELKEIGGSIRVDSQPGQGSSFHMRLPFTVSVNRALMVMAGEDSYAIPLNTIEGVVRVSPYELEALYEEERATGQPATFEYAGEDYTLKYIGDLLNSHQQPKLVGKSLPLPVILVRSSEYAVAVQVDVLAGSREIVVKGLGPQFANVHGISGATILGDGRVVVILDLLASIRLYHANQALDAELEQPRVAEAAVESAPTKLAMVVDDSVTVRKVTTRLLERHGMNVVTARDGVDAVAQLQEHKPDIMLLDIEMPRMDGFEVATLIRHDAQLKDLPIIMITSRTGEKHRERALAIGVNDYLGKPYQETALLAAIDRLLS